ncbi:MAG: hypothetical protein JXQ30_08315 [Spirochaetes bacterium]|nr:hypothetical protein [Spirochaetota bacterium]
MMKKIVLIALIVIGSILLFVIFILYNFPYHTLMERASDLLRLQAGVSLSVGETRYRFPLKVVLADVHLAGVNPPLAIEIKEATVRLGLFGDNLKINGNGYRIAGEGVEAKGSDFELGAAMQLRGLGGSTLFQAVKAASLVIYRARVERLFIMGFEFSSFIVSEVRLSAEKKDGSLVFRQGSVKSELFLVNITGSISENRVDVRTAITPTEKFFRNYSNLGGMLASFSDDETLNFTIQGDFEHPTVTLENKTRR